MTFGSYLRRMRGLRKLRQEDLASKIGVSTVYICDIEKNRRYPPSLEKLRTWAAQLNLSKEEAAEFFDLAGDSRESAPPDIMEYLSRNPAAREAIRRVMDKSVKYDWDTIA